MGCTNLSSMRQTSFLLALFFLGYRGGLFLKTNYLRISNNLLFFTIIFIERSDHFLSDSIITRRSLARYVVLYSTLIGLVWQIFLVIKPSLSRLLRFSVKTFCEIPSITFLISLKPLGLSFNRLSINIVHLPLTREIISLEGHCFAKTLGCDGIGGYRKVPSLQKKLT